MRTRTRTGTGPQRRLWMPPGTYQPTARRLRSGRFVHVCNGSVWQGVLEVRVRSHTSTGGEPPHAPVVLPDKLVKGASQGGRRGSPRGATSVAASGGCAGGSRPQGWREPSGRGPAGRGGQYHGGGGRLRTACHRQRLRQHLQLLEHRLIPLRRRQLVR